MIVRHIQSIILAYLVCLVASQNARSYDTSDWVPITQKTNEETASKKATGRVLNLDAPNRNFFPDENYSHRKQKPIPSSYTKKRDKYNVPKYEEENYKFELPRFSPPGGPKINYFTNQEVNLPNYEQPPSLEPYGNPPRPLRNKQSQTSVPNTREVAPAPEAASIYDKFSVPYNNPNLFNQELLGTIPHHKNANSINTPVSPQSNHPNNVPIPSTTPSIEMEAVQLVYVPLENLKPNQPITQDSQAVYKQVESPGSNDKITTNNNANQIAAIQQDFIEQALRATKLQQQFESGEPIIQRSPPTPTAKPTKKRKPHQPPLSVYMEGHQPADVEDVLEILKDAKSISVQDSVQPDSPPIFIGPTSLDPPEGYSKFPLPYLNSIDGNRIEKKIENLPFFVAPLSFKAPQGYSKIPLPAPHVGSVVVSNKEDTHEQKRSTPAYDGLKAVTPIPTYFNDNLTPQVYQNQDYYNQGIQISSPQPQISQFSDHNKFSGQSGYYQTSSNNNHNFPQGVDQQIYSLNKNQHNPAFEYSSGQTDVIRTTPRYTDQSNTNYRSTPASNQEVDIPARTTLNQDTQGYNLANLKNQDHPTKLEQNYQNYETQYHSNERDFHPRLESISNNEQYNAGSTADSKAVEQKQSTNTHSTENEQNIRTLDVNPLELAINEFELHQINSQLEQKPRIKNQYDYDSGPRADQRDQGRQRTRQRIQTTTVESQYKFDPELHRFSSTPASILRDTNIETTIRPINTKARRRGRPTKPTTTTPAPTEKESYTVLEEFSVEPENSQYSKNPSYPDRSQYPEAAGYQGNFGNQFSVENIDNPANVYTLRKTTPSYTATDIGATKSETVQDFGKTIIEDIPAKVYELGIVRNSQVDNAPVYKENVPTYDSNIHSQNQHNLNQHLMDQQILQDVYKENTQESGGRENYRDSTHSPQYEIPSNIEPLVQNRGQYQENQREVNVQVIPEINSDLNYEDPSVRSLLVPNLLVPRAQEDDYAAPKYLPTTESVITTTPSTTTSTTTTEKYIETTTPSRTRGRQRGGGRYNVPTTRKVSSRRRTSQTQRTTTERSSYTIEAGDNQRASTRQRFRTRGRTTPNPVSETASTTENHVYNSPTSESGNEPQPYLQSEDDVKIQQTSTGEDVNNGGDRIETTSQISPQINYENTVTTPRMVINNINHPVHNEVRSHSDNNYRNDENSRSNIKIRGRVRGRSRPVSTTTEEVTTRQTSRPVQKDEPEEFFGFFRQPNFSQPPVYQAESVSSTSKPIAQYESTPNHSRDNIRLHYDNTRESYSTTPRFVGELVPKYQATNKEIEIEDVTTPRSRIRARTRSSQRQTNPRVSLDDSTESSTKNSNILRSRGRTHYKVPENLKRETEDDVEGGNYPAEFFINKQQFSTRSPSFQITVAPEDEADDDQVPHHSLYRPNILPRPEEWHEASQYDAGDNGQNNLVSDSLNNESGQTTTEEPIALPIQATTGGPVTSSNDKSKFEGASEAIKIIFEGIDDQYEKSKDTTKKPTTNGRRRGAWKLVKHRPVDRFEVAESQNYYAVLNSFDDIKKVNNEKQIENHEKMPINSDESQNFYSVMNSYDDLRKINISVNIDKGTELPNGLKEEEETNIETTDNYPTTTESVSESDNMYTEEPAPHTTFSFETTTQTTKHTNSEDGSFLRSLYEMLGVSSSEKILENTTLNSASDYDTEAPATTISNPNLPEEITEVLTSTTTRNVTEVPPETTTEMVNTTHELAQTISPFEVEPWEMKVVRTSTSTEVSHETEICYKGRCIKAAEKKKKL